MPIEISAENQEPAAQRLTTAVLIGGIAGFAGLYLASIGPYWNISPDSASYMGWGASLAAGTGWGSPPINPPMTALVFAAVIRLFPTGYTALNALTPVLLFLSLGFAYVLLERRGGRVVALLAILLSLAAIPFYRATTQLLSEPVYMVFSMGALLALDRFTARRAGSDPSAGGSGRSGMLVWVAGVLMVITVLSRTVGVTLAVAVLLVEAVGWLRRRQRPSAVLVGFAVASLASVAIWQAYSGTSYASSWFDAFVLRDPWNPGAGSLSSAEALDRISRNAGFLPRAGGLLLNGWTRNHRVLDIALQVSGTLLVAWGLLLALRKRIGVLEVYFGVYVLLIAAHMLAGGDGEYRFLVPVVPLVFYYAIAAAQQLGRLAMQAPAPRWAAVMLAGMGALYLTGYLRIGWDRVTAGVAEAHYSPFGDYLIKRPENPDALQLALWLKEHSTPQERYAAAQRDMFDVLTERRGDDILLSHTHPPAAFLHRLVEGRVRYVLVDRRLEVGNSMMAAIRTNPERFLLIRELPAASLYEFKRQGPE